MRIRYTLFLSVAALLLTGCADDVVTRVSPTSADARELTGVRAYIEGGSGATRAGSVTPLVDYVGRSEFASGDVIVFTEIHRTDNPLTEFTYPGNNDYEGIVFLAGNEGGWQRSATDGGPERVYWTDAVSPHTFVSYSRPKADSYDWKKYQFEQVEGGNTVKKTYYLGSIGNPLLPGIGQEGQCDTIDYTDGASLLDEDLLISHNTDMQAEPGGSVALVKFRHALSSVRVVVNISGFSASSEAADTATVVSDMLLLHQPTMYVWMQAGWGAQPLRAARDGAAVTDQEMVDKAWTGSTASSGVAYNQRKDMKLWIPKPKGSGSKQSKTFTFYGITTPQPQDYFVTLGNSPQRKAELKFNVTYPNPMKPDTTVTRTYTASLDSVFFEAGYNTTINISLNHKNEEMTVGAEYENWMFVATPDVGQLRKNSTFLQDTLRSNITIHTDAAATADDAIWLYEDNGKVYDIYGHSGNTADSAYQISTAYQLMSFAHEVKNGYDFTGKFVRLDADLTLQTTSDKVKEEIVATYDADGKITNSSQINDTKEGLVWMGIGDDKHAFNGTFLGGNRFIYRLKGSPLFAALGADAKIEQLQLNAITIGNGESVAVSGSGLFAETNAGRICACKVVGDVTMDATTAGAFVGENAGQIFASYHIGATKSTAASATVGGLVGTNSGVISSCYHAGTVTGSTTGGIAGADSGTLANNYYNSTLCTPTFTPDSGVTAKSAGDMTKQDFVETRDDGDALSGGINYGIQQWRASHPGYDDHSYVYQPANYPKLD